MEIVGVIVGLVAWIAIAYAIVGNFGLLDNKRRDNKWVR